jgi:hypothetical protein
MIGDADQVGQSEEENVQAGSHRDLKQSLPVLVR